MAKRIVEREVEIYTVTAPFDEGGKHYEPGEEFEVPANWTRDTVHEEIVNQKNDSGRVCFMQPETPGDDTGKGYKPGRRVLLPLSEAAKV